jgi:hypothetical protein
MRTILESPFRPPPGGVAPYSERETLRQNLVYAKLCLDDALKRGEAPFASHLLYTQVWAETNELREAGIKAGNEWRRAAGLCVLYVDLGTTGGMKRAADDSRSLNIDVTTRRLFALEDDVRARLADMRLTGFPALEALEKLEAKR